VRLQKIVRLQKPVIYLSVGVAATGIAAAAFASGSTAAPVHSHTPAHVAPRAHSVRPAASRLTVTREKTLPTKRAATTKQSAGPTDVVSTSREQVAWTQRAAADTTPAVEHCTPVSGPDGTLLHDPSGGLVYPALVNDAQAENDIAAMYTAMAAGDQAAYDTAYHKLDLRTNCD
jgi:hypothetical protein